MHLFIENLFDPEMRFFYLSWVVVATISIVLHELAHGWAAIRHGDDTPREQGRMTGNPLVHMGGMSLIALVVFGIAWGQMPIDPTRMRGRYAEAKVSAAGPGMNLILAVLCSIGLGLMWRFGVTDEPGWRANALELLLVGGAANFVLMLFNLFPVPPLDGSHILANVNHKYARFVSDPRHQGVFLLGFIFIFAISVRLWPMCYGAALSIARFVATVGA